MCVSVFVPSCSARACVCVYSSIHHLHQIPHYDSSCLSVCLSLHASCMCVCVHGTAHVQRYRARWVSAFCQPPLQRSRLTSTEIQTEHPPHCDSLCPLRIKLFRWGCSADGQGAGSWVGRGRNIGWKSLGNQKWDDRVKSKVGYGSCYRSWIKYRNKM